MEEGKKEWRVSRGGREKWRFGGKKKGCEGRGTGGWCVEG